MAKKSPGPTVKTGIWERSTTPPKNVPMTIEDIFKNCSAVPREFFASVREACLTVLRDAGIEIAEHGPVFCRQDGNHMCESMLPFEDIAYGDLLQDARVRDAACVLANLRSLGELRDYRVFRAGMAFCRFMVRPYEAKYIHPPRVKTPQHAKEGMIASGISLDDDEKARRLDIYRKLIASGTKARAAAKAVGVHYETIRKWKY